MNRQCPKDCAKCYRMGTKKRGANRKTWEVKKRSNGVKYWKQINGVTTKRKTIQKQSGGEEENNIQQIIQKYKNLDPIWIRDLIGEYSRYSIAQINLEIQRRLSHYQNEQQLNNILSKNNSMPNKLKQNLLGDKGRTGYFPIPIEKYVKSIINNDKSTYNTMTLKVLKDRLDKIKSLQYLLKLLAKLYQYTSLGSIISRLIPNTYSELNIIRNKIANKNPRKIGKIVRI